MPPPKKAAKKVAKKAAKKAAGSDRQQDTRRCYEHFGRVLTLLPLLPDTGTVSKMASLAQELLRSGQTKDAADMLRAAEHLSFGTLASTSASEAISDSLSETLRAEYLHLLERADHHAAAEDLSGPVARLFSLMRKQAVQAFKAGKFRSAAELARGAEALAHVKADVAGRLRAGDLKQFELS